VKKSSAYVVAAIILAIGLCLFGFWCSGFDFTERGPKAGACFATTIYVSLAAALITKMFVDD
jgi:hypothetical protein